MSDINWDDIDPVVVPQGSYIGWGEVGQRVTGYVISYSDTDGSDFNGESCPQVVLQLTEGCTNFRDLRSKTPTKETIAAGEFVTVECGLTSLKKNVRSAALDVGNLVRITYDGTFMADKFEGKSFKVQVSRSARPSVTSNDLV